MTLSKGDVVDRYVIDAPLGAGGMGEVYRARDTRLQRNVALKILRLDPSTGSTEGPERRLPTDAAARMLREARAAAALDHPNVVAIFDVGQIREDGPLDGTTYLAMELIKGRPLRAFVGDSSITMRLRIGWLCDAARALGAAHDAGLVHRDMKPDNVMVRDDGVVKVLDFGIARRAPGAPINATASTEGYAIPSVTEQGVLVGTPLYIAPEQLRGDPLDGRADQFSWGVMAYELLTGDPPWRTDEGPVALLSQVLTGKPPPLDRFDEIPPHAKATVLRTLEKDRGARFASMREVIAALEGDADPFAPTASKIATGKTALSSRTVDALGVGVGPTERAPIPGGSVAPPPSTSSRTTNRAISSTRPPVMPPARRSRAFSAAFLGVVAIGAVGAGVAWRARRPAAPSTVASASAGAAPVAGCVSSSACAREHGGEAWICRASDKQCVAVASQDCTAKYEPRDLEQDDTIWIGAMFPLKGPQAKAFGQMNADGVELAREEISGATRPLADEGSAQRVRRIAVAMCDDSEDPMRAAKHLVDDVGAPAIVGFKSGDEILDVAGGLLIKRGVMTVASLTQSPLIAKLPHPAGSPPLVWRTTYSYDGVADATAAFVHEVIEPRLHAPPPLRVVVVRFETTALDAFSERLFRTLVFNGKPAVQNGRDYSETLLKPGSSIAEVERAGDSLAAQRPGVVLILLDGASARSLVHRTEERWPSASQRPVYVGVNMPEPFWPVVGRDAQRRHRVFSVVSLSDTTRNARFVMRFNALRSPPVTREFNPGPSYDAMYLAAYAALSLGERPVTGLALAESVSRLRPPGHEVEAGPTGLLAGLSALAEGRAIDLQGVQSDLDFDLATGESPVDFALFCPDIGVSGVVDGEAESGVRFRASASTVEGSLHCP